MPAPTPKPRTLYDKIWDDHVVCVASRSLGMSPLISCAATSTKMVSLSSTSTGGYLTLVTVCVLTVSHRHLVHEVTSPQAFEGLCVQVNLVPSKCIPLIWCPVAPQAELFVGQTVRSQQLITMYRESLRERTRLSTL